MRTKEKAHLSGGPIPKSVLADGSEYIALQIQLQVSSLIRRAGVDGDMAVTLAPMVFGVLL